MHRSDLFNLLHKCFEQYDVLLNSDYYNDKEINIEEFLTQICQPVWDFLSLNCPSFAKRDCNAQSEIFSVRVTCVFNFINSWKQKISRGFNFAVYQNI